MSRADTRSALRYWLAFYERHPAPFGMVGRFDVMPTIRQEIAARLLTMAREDGEEVSP